MQNSPEQLHSGRPSTVFDKIHLKTLSSGRKGGGTLNVKQLEAIAPFRADNLWSLTVHWFNKVAIKVHAEVY